MQIRFLAVFVLLLSAVSSAAAQSFREFGRFGRLHDDGLLTLNVTPQGFSIAPTAGNVRFVWGNGGTPIRARVTKLDSTEKRLALTGGGSGAPTAIRYTLLYPGLSATFGKTIVLAVPSNLKRTELRLKDRNAWLFTPPNGSPVAMLFRKGIKTSALWASSSGGSTVYRLASKEPFGEVPFVTPIGLRNAKGNETALRAELERWTDLPLPSRQTTKAAVSSDGRRVTITETFRGNIAPIPPVLAFAIANGYPATVSGSVVTTGSSTKWGAFAYVRGNTLRYTLPVPPMEERGYVRPANPAPGRIALLNDLVGHLGGTWAKNAVDLGYAGMTNAQMAEPFLTPARRTEVAAAWKGHLSRAFLLDSPAWNRTVEPLTQLLYRWTYKIDGPGGYNYDIEWGNALPLYGLYKYAQFTGDWGLVRRLWSSVPTITRYFDYGDDWAWMTVVNADHGFSTGTGDPMCAYYAGIVALAKMARAIGDKAAAEKWTIRAARVAVPMVARFRYTDYGRKYGELGPTGCALGFQEKEGFTRSNFGQSPWWPTTLLSGDGALPEVMALYRSFGRQPVAEFLACYAAAYPRWYEGSHRYPFTDTYSGNSVYVTFPHILARAIVSDEPTPALWKYANAAQSNRNNAWIGPNVVAELLARDTPLILTEWAPAAYRGGVASVDNRRVTLNFALASAGTWRMTARLKPGFVPSKVLLNGKSVPFTAKNGVLSLNVSRPAGGFVVVVQR
jgi:hypothetical protein